MKPNVAAPEKEELLLDPDTPPVIAGALKAHAPRPDSDPMHEALVAPEWYVRCLKCNELCAAGWGSSPVGTLKPFLDYENWRFLNDRQGQKVKRGVRSMSCPLCFSDLPMWEAARALHPRALINPRPYAFPSNRQGLTPSDIDFLKVRKEWRE